MAIKLWVTSFSIALVSLGCGDKSDVIYPPGYVNEKIEPRNIEILRSNKDKTKKLFDEAGAISLGDKYGKFELRPEGMLIHPGEFKPTVVNFSIDNKYKNIKINMFIAPLPPNAKDIKEAGTVGVELFVDGRSIGLYVVDRTSPVTQILELEGVKILTLKVDNQDKKSWFDWLILGVGE